MGYAVTEKEYEIQYYEIDYKKRLLITNLMKYLSDIAIKQSEDLGVGLDYLIDKGVAWVLYKWNIDIKRYPLYGEKIKVTTTPHSFRKFYAYRKFEIKDQSGNTIANADSIWFLIDIEKRKAIRIAEDVYTSYGIDGNEKKPLDIEKIKKPEKIDVQKSFEVRYSDIDTNKHVNNVKYLEWAIETVPLNVVLNLTMTNVNIVYEKETTYGDTVLISTEVINENEGYVCTHKIDNKEGKQLALIKTYWK